MLTPVEQQLVERARNVSIAEAELTRSMESARAILREAKEALAATQRLRDDISRIEREKTVCFPWLADAISQYYEMCDLKLAEYLELKVRPARKEAYRVRRISRSKREIHYKFLIARNRVRYYESLFPHIREYVGDDLDDLVKAVPSTETSSDSTDPSTQWLTSAEWQSLSEADRHQRALDNYDRRKKQPWELGRDYERATGYTYERQGYRVSYFGATEGLSDLGRDLIAKRGDETLVIQCKYWRPERRVREKHVFQLYGTCVEYWLKSGGKNRSSEPVLFPAANVAGLGTIEPVFVTSASLSNEAREYAQALGVTVRENVAMDEYPRVKCNISRSGDRIFHLPFDQQYDRVVIGDRPGEMHVATVHEAVAAGFRRAFRWRGDGPHAK